jgi:hypothetical protein
LVRFKATVSTTRREVSMASRVALNHVERTYNSQSIDLDKQLVEDLAKILYDHFCATASTSNDRLLPQLNQEPSSKVGA